MVGDKEYISLCDTYYLRAGYIYVTQKPTVIATVLGSCVSVCLYDTENRFGGMNHYLFPEAKSKGERTAKYGDVSIMELYRTMREFGSVHKNIVAQVVGGGFLEGNPDSEFISKENINVCKRILEKLHIKIISEDTGGLLGRKVLYITEYNELAVTKLKKIRLTDYYYNQDVVYK